MSEDTYTVQEEKGLNVPLDIFSSDLSSLEALIKYLKENCALSYTVIAQMLNRDARTVWGTYRRSIKKCPDPLSISCGNVAVPLALFRDRSLGVLEALTFYLKETLGMRYCQIAGLIQRDDRTVWTSFARARRKLNAAK